MPKLEAKSGKSTDCAFKLFGRTIPVKSSADCCENSGGFDGENEEKGGLKRPTKVVACPRCESMDTKFCYFNNYNVNQPRHYCRKCQRYWTAGGALRNVPVGAGRRKNKPSFGIHQGHFVEVSENVWTDGQTCIPMRPSLNSDKLVKVESVYPELRIFDEGFNGAEAAYAQGKPKPQSYLDGYSHRLNLPSEKNVKEGFEKPLGVDLCGKELPESYTHAGKRVGSGYMEKPSCSLSDKTQVSATKGESSSEVVQTMDDGVCDSSLNGMVSAGPKSEPQAMRPNDFSSSSFPPYSSMSVIGNSWPVYYNGYFANMPSGISTSGSLTNGVSWFPPSLAHGGNWHVPSGSIWGQQWGLPWKLGNTDSDLKTLGKHERDEATPASKTDRDRSLWMPKTQRINDSGEALNSSFVEGLEVERKIGSIKSGGIFKAFQSKKVKEVLCSNPAELSRSTSSTESS